MILSRCVCTQGKKRRSAKPSTQRRSPLLSVGRILKDGEYKSLGAREKRRGYTVHSATEENLPPCPGVPGPFTGSSHLRKRRTHVDTTGSFKRFSWGRLRRLNTSLRDPETDDGLWPIRNTDRRIQVIMNCGFIIQEVA